MLVLSQKANLEFDRAAFFYPPLHVVSSTPSVVMLPSTFLL
jgi:hypothetical protein